MASRGTFLLRANPEILDALRKWAEEEFRSVNGQIEFVLRRALSDAGRLPEKRANAERPKPRNE